MSAWPCSLYRYDQAGRVHHRQMYTNCDMYLSQSENYFGQHENIERKHYDELGTCRPSSVTTAVWNPPHETCRGLFPNSVSTNLGTWQFFSLAWPNRPNFPSPQLYNSPSAVKQLVWNPQAESWTTLLMNSGKGLKKKKINSNQVSKWLFQTVCFDLTS